MPRHPSEAVHIGLDYIKAVDAKKSILLSEATLLKVIKRIRSYSSLRKKEFTVKNKLRKTLVETKRTILDVENLLPSRQEVELPEKEKTENNKRKLKSQETLGVLDIEQRKEKLTEKKKDRDLEKELKEIQEKLASLG